MLQRDDLTGQTSVGNLVGILVRPGGVGCDDRRDFLRGREYRLRQHGAGIDIDASCLVEGNVIGTNLTGTALAKPAMASWSVGWERHDRRDLRPTRMSSPATRATASTSMRPAWWRATRSAPTGPGPTPCRIRELASISTREPPSRRRSGLPAPATSSRSTAAPAWRPPGTTGSTIRFNAIFGNGGPGIDLNDDGVTANTPNGPNNTPVLTSVGGAIITGTLNASPNSTYIVDFYANPSSDVSPARPQGRDVPRPR